MIGILGISHKSAPLDIRERFSFSKNQIQDFGEIVLRDTEISELVIISTCNRTEIYYYHEKSCIKKTDKQLRTFLHQYKNVSDDCSDHLYTFSNTDAVNHLFSVTSGMKSMVFGEDQIVNQVKEAYLHSTNLAFTDAVLMRLFQKSFETGKKVRTQTDIQKGATSVGYVAVEQCLQLCPDLKNKEILFVGTGETGRLVLQKMKKTGVKNFHFTNRTFDNALELANENNGKAVGFEDFVDYLPECDVIITATSAGKAIISKTDIENSLRARNQKPQIYIDLSVPRNIAPSADNLPNVNILSVDSLQKFIELTAAKRKSCKKDAENIIDQMASEFFAWFDNRSLRPVITAITGNMQKMHQVELHKYKNNYSEETFKAVDEYAGRLTQKYIRTLIKKLKELNENGEVTHSLETINNLFEFEIEKIK